MNRLLVIAAGVTLGMFTSCDNCTEEITSLQQENRSLKEQLEVAKTNSAAPLKPVQAEPQTDSLTYEEVRALIMEIENNLVAIQNEEQKIKELKEEDPESFSEDELVNRVIAIHSLSEANKEKFFYLNKQLKSKDGSIKIKEEKVLELQTEVKALDSKIQHSQTTVDVLKQEVVDLNRDIDMLEGAIEEVYDSGQEFFEESDRAFIAIGTQDYFVENGLLVTEGGFMGIGSSTHVNPDFDQTLFEEIEKSLTEEIFIDSKILSLASSHPSGTYEIKEQKEQYLLRITDPSFWRQSRHLILLTAE